jgi:O-glycosyl hydrolase
MPFHAESLRIAKVRKEVFLRLLLQDFASDLGTMRLSPLKLLVLFAGLAVCVASFSKQESASFNSAGSLTALIQDGREIPIHAYFEVSFAGGVHQNLQPHDQRSPIMREGLELAWKGSASFPNSGQAQFEVQWTEQAGGLSLAGTLTSGAPERRGGPGFKGALEVEAVDYVIDLPRALFRSWNIGDTGLVFPESKPASPMFFGGLIDKLELRDPANNWKLALGLDSSRPISITDVWENEEQFFRIRIQLGKGLWQNGEQMKLGLKLALQGKAQAEPATVNVDSKSPLYDFQGFGGNFCFNTETPVADFLIEDYSQAWARFEMKLVAWDRERKEPGPALKRDFQLMRKVQRKGIPWIISVWRVPEHFYSDANQKPSSTFGRTISPERWPEFLKLIGSYLTYIKEKHKLEPDLFSFNEPDLGVSVGFSAEAHREAIKRIGAHLASLGLKTKMLLGDTANPRDSHKYVLPTAADPEAMKYVSMLSVHSWGNGSPAQYQAWAKVAEWLKLPLLVGEAGVDPGSWRNRMFDSYAYGLREAAQYQDLLRHAHPAALIYWQYTEDYGLMRVGADKKPVPTGRYWLMKQFSNLTPRNSQVLTSSSDQPEVLVSAFSKDKALVLHVLNTGPAREINAKLPAGKWSLVSSTETSSGLDKTKVDPSKPVQIPARSLNSFILEN